MTTDLKLDPETHRLVVENGNIQLISGEDQILQAVRQSLKLFMGECFLHRRRGVPYFQQIFVKGVNRSVVDSAIKQAILSVDGVVKLKTVKYNLDTVNRSLNVEFEALTIYGLINSEVVV